MKPSSLLAATALVAVLAASAPVSAALLSVDINDRVTADNPDTAPGFSVFSLDSSSSTTAALSTPSTAVINGYTVTLVAFDDGLDENAVTAGVQSTTGQIDDRDRGTPTNSGALTYGQLYDDLVFAGGSTGPTGGMNLSISGGGLLPNTPYLVSIYAFDSGSTPAPQPRTANWLDGNNNNAVVLSTSFNAAELPTTDHQYRFSGYATTDANGALLLLGRNTTPNATAGGVSVGVILNGFEVEVPEPASAGMLGLTAAAALGVRRRR